MTRRTVFILIAAALVIALLGTAYWMWRPEGYAASYELRERLEATIASGTESFDFAGHELEWDRMYVFAPYSTRGDVEGSLGFPWPEYGRTSIRQDDSVCLVIFLKGKSVVAWYEQPRTVDLSWLANGQGYDRSAARFRIDRTCQPVALTEWATTSR